MGRWSVLPKQRLGSLQGPGATYFVPMTPAASTAQVAMMQNRQLMSQAEHIQNAVDEGNNKAENAISIASEVQREQIDLRQGFLKNQGMIFLIIAIIIILFLFFMRRNEKILDNGSFYWD